MANCDVVRLIPGPQGPAGSNGTNGTNGANAFTTTSADFTMPAIGANVTVTVGSSAWMSPNGVPANGQMVHVQNAGHMLVVSLPSSTQATLQNSSGYSNNAAGGTNIPSGSKVSPAGLIGPAGASGAAGVGVTVAAKGELQTHNGVAAASLAVGTDGQMVRARAAAANGIDWFTFAPNGATDNVVARFDASGVTSPTPVQSSSIAITDTGACQHTGGNAKGTSAVDLQPVRGAATQVASGNNSTIPGGQNNTASGPNSFAVGASNLASGSAAVAMGSSSTASGDNSVVIGLSSTASNTQAVAIGSSHSVTSTGGGAVAGDSSIVSGDNAFVAGGSSCIARGVASLVAGRLSVSETGSDYGVVTGYRGLADKYAQKTHAAGPFAIPGDAQVSELMWRITTTDATANVEMFLDGSAAVATVPSNSTWGFQILLTARRSNGDSFVYKAEGGIKNDAGNCVLVAAITEAVVADGTGGALGVGSVDVDANNVNDTLRIRVTGIAAQTWRWVAHGRIVEVAH